MQLHTSQIIFKDLKIVTQVDSITISVEYDNGDREVLSTTEVLRDGILSLGWVNTRASSESPSDPCSDAGMVHPMTVSTVQVKPVNESLLRHVPCVGLHLHDI